MYQCAIVGENGSPFPARRSHVRALEDAKQWVWEAAPRVAAEWLAWLSLSDDPDFESRDLDYDYLVLVYADGCDEERALFHARQWLWDQVIVTPV